MGRFFLKVRVHKTEKALRAMQKGAKIEQASVPGRAGKTMKIGDLEGRDPSGRKITVTVMLSLA